MALRILKAENLPSEGEYKPGGTLGTHHLVVLENDGKEATIRGSKDDYPVTGMKFFYNCGHIAVGEEKKEIQCHRKMTWIKHQIIALRAEEEKLLNRAMKNMERCPTLYPSPSQEGHYFGNDANKKIFSRTQQITDEIIKFREMAKEAVTEYAKYRNVNIEIEINEIMGE